MTRVRSRWQEAGPATLSGDSITAGSAAPAAQGAPPERECPRRPEHEREMERPYTPDGSADDARTAALDERPTPRRNRRRERFGRGERAIPEYEPPDWREHATSGLPRDAEGHEDATSALPRELARDNRTAALPSDGHWRDEHQPPRQLVLDRYSLERRIGAGGFGVVWLAFDEKLQREVAVKV